MNATLCSSAQSPMIPAASEPMQNAVGPHAIPRLDERMASCQKHDSDSAVYVVDHDADVCRALAALLAPAGHLVQRFQSATDFLGHACRDIASCLLVEVGPQCTEGLQLLQRPAGSWPRPAVVLMTPRDGDIAVAVSAMKAGAIDVLTKPLLQQAVLDAVDGALAQDRQWRASRRRAMVTLQRAATLTPRERQVMALVTSGLMNKQVASELSLSEISIKIHRGNLMKKMGLRTLPDLVRAADLLTQHA